MVWKGWRSVESKNWVADGSGGDGGRSVVFGTNVGAISTKYHASERLDLPSGCGARCGHRRCRPCILWPRAGGGGTQACTVLRGVKQDGPHPPHI